MADGDDGAEKHKDLIKVSFILIFSVQGLSVRSV